MSFKNILAMVSAAALVTTPALAANPAAKLSVSSSVRASAHKGDSNIFGVSGFVPVLLLAAVAVAAIVVLKDGDSSNSP